MINLIFGLLGACAYVATSFAFARCAYRHEYNLIYGSPAPSVYGGKHGHEKADEVAMREAVWWLALWPLFMSWTAIGWLITHGIEQGWVEATNKIKQIQEEVDRLAVSQDPLAGLDRVMGAESVSHSRPVDDPYWEAKLGPLNDPCPCGYVTECHIHCGSLATCHKSMVKAEDDRERGAVLRVAHPEHVRVYDIGTLDDPEKKLTVVEPPRYLKIGFRTER